MNLLIPKILEKYSEENEVKKSNNNKVYLEKSTDIVNGYDVFNLYNVKKFMKAKLDKIGIKFEVVGNKINNRASLYSNISMISSLLSQSLIFVFAVILVSKQIIIPGALLGIGNMAGKFFTNCYYFISEVVKIKGYNFLIKDKMESEKVYDDNIYNLGNGNIEINNLVVEYGDKIILNIEKLIFETGKKYVIVGKSGSGKSTLFNVILKKIKDYKGTVKISGVDIKPVNEYSIYNNIGIMEQKAYIFNDSIKNNICLGREANENEIDSLLKVTRLSKDFISSDIMINKNSSNISGGQAQRIALARQLLMNKQILLFDEAFSALDNKMISDILGDILLRNNTMIFIAHNFDDEILLKFDKIINLDSINNLNHL